MCCKLPPNRCNPTRCFGTGSGSNKRSPPIFSSSLPWLSRICLSRSELSWCRFQSQPKSVWSDHNNIKHLFKTRYIPWIYSSLRLQTLWTTHTTQAPSCLPPVLVPSSLASVHRPAIPIRYVSSRILKAKQALHQQQGSQCDLGVQPF